MITEEHIIQLITPTLKEKKCFLVTLDIRQGNNILIEIDNLEGVKISDCVEISRAIEHNIDREIEDFELQVSSPGLDKPLKVIEQYKKNIGRRVQIETTENTTFSGELLAVNNDEIIVIAIENSKKPTNKSKINTEQKELNINQIKETKIIISFK